MIADAFSPVQVLEQGAQQAKGEQARMVRGPARPESAPRARVNLSFAYLNQM